MRYGKYLYLCVTLAATAAFAGYEEDMNACDRSDAVCVGQVLLRAIQDGPAAPDASLRISGTNNVLQVFHAGSWRGVCDDTFSDQAGIVACRQLGGTFRGFSGGVTGDSDSFWLDGFSCTGNETTLAQCSGYTWGSEDCGVSEHVNLICN